jgi:hypothetical protein
VPNFARTRKRLEAKAIPLGPFWYGSGHGRQPWPIGSQYDWAGAVGSLADSSIVAIALAWIRRNITSGRIVVGTEADGEYVPADDHPLIGVLKRPNPWDSWRATIGGTADSLAVDGNAFWLKGLGRLLRDTQEVYWAPNHTIEVVPEADQRVAAEKGPVRGYYHSDGGKRQWYEPGEVVHFRNGRDPYMRYMGLSELKRQLRNVGSIAFAERYTGAVLRNAHAGKVLAPKQGSADVMPDTPDDAQLEGLRRQLERGIEGENAGRITKVGLAVDLLDAGLGPEDMALDRIPDRPEAYILAALGLNALTLGLPSSKDVATYANKGEARREAWENAVIPMQDLIAEEIEAQLLPDFGEEAAADCVWWDRSDVEAMREDANERAARAVSLFTASVSTLNEARGMVDLDPLEGDEGDLTPMERADAAMERQAAMMPEDEDEPEPAGNGRANGRY